MKGLIRIAREIHRRSLWQIFAAYIVLSAVVFEVSTAIADRRQLPQAFVVFALVLLMLGLPFVLVTGTVQRGIPAVGRSEPTLRVGAGDGEEQARSRAERYAARHIFTWRNAGLGGLAAFTFWAIIAVGWLVLANQLVDNARESGTGKPPVERER